MKPFKFLLFSLVFATAIFVAVFEQKTPHIPQADEQTSIALKIIEKHYANDQYDEAMNGIQVLLAKQTPSSTVSAKPEQKARFTDYLEAFPQNKLSKEVLVWLYEKQADIYERRRHYHHAIDSYHEAYVLSQKNRYKSRARDLSKWIEQHQNERTLKNSYKDSRNTGIAKSLKHDVTIAYVYLDDRKGDKWSGKARMRNHHNINQVTNWYQREAKRYQIENLNIQVRYFFIKSPRGLSKKWLGSREFFPAAVKLIASQLGFSGLNGFMQSIQSNNKHHQVALVFHSNSDARSFARTCPASAMYKGCQYEYVMLTEKMSSTHQAWSMTQTQSHEMLHLFGAADLYNINNAKDFAVTDLMNYYSSELKYANITPITAWAIGWSELPTTPFTVDVIKDK